MQKALKNTIADIKFNLDRLVRSQDAKEQTQSLFLLEKALELVQLAEDRAETTNQQVESGANTIAMVQTLLNSDSRFHLN
ncbi:MAG: hypothetical protein NWQ54_11255 [Paraglaciecola sp.]|uniref:hypothetical protein n=1 Tax=Pseudomonadati TaxID=3379134 RepID=UPI00273D1643|nr:hypothetical protein [Paraglaciecola sp.]MDP5030405.1 hypothetical protein [Paraglaciecola sp.]MDP5041706.1 hypothetical protein [Paraglaciecola sp.]MDP5131452.1 hypothetical protein [Paraglaciecola sp.]